MSKKPIDYHTTCPICGHSTGIMTSYDIRYNCGEDFRIGYTKTKRGSYQFFHNICVREAINENRSNKQLL